MSIRTVIEINHDYLGTFDEQDFMDLIRGLKSTKYNAQLNAAGYVEPVLGIRIIAQRHHSETLDLRVS